MELKDIVINAELHAHGDTASLGTRTIARWIADIAKWVVQTESEFQKLDTVMRKAVEAMQPKPDGRAPEPAPRYRTVDPRAFGHVEGSRAWPNDPPGYTDGDMGGQALRALAADPDVGTETYQRVRTELRAANERIGRLLVRAKELETQNRVTQEQLEKFQSACADQTIQIMELRGNLRRAPDEPTREELEARYQRAERAELGERDARKQIMHYEAQLSRLRDVVLNGKTMNTEALITEAIDEIHAPCPDCLELGKQLDLARESCAVADGDRVPLAMDLENAQTDLKETREQVNRMAHVIKAAEKTHGLWNGSEHILTAPMPSPLIAALCEQSDAVNEYEVACSQANKPADDDIAF